MPEIKTIKSELVRHRFILAMFAISVASVALFTGHMSDLQWNVALGGILGAYSWAAKTNTD